jgi:hypothetical protein
MTLEHITLWVEFLVQYDNKMYLTFILDTIGRAAAGRACRRRDREVPKSVRPDGSPWGRRNGQRHIRGLTAKRRTAIQNTPEMDQDGQNEVGGEMEGIRSAATRYAQRASRMEE